jgi:hypothetical protein
MYFFFFIFALRLSNLYHGYGKIRIRVIVTLELNIVDFREKFTSSDSWGTGSRPPTVTFLLKITFLFKSDG